MNSTVEKFNQKIEELKKRLKAISTSQNILSKLNALEDYFKQIQDYLNSINTSFSDHITQSENYSENIATLQSQIADVQQQIQNLPDLEDLNLTQMQADISTLQNDLSTLKGSSNRSISNLESQIATIQADISTITTQISTLQSNISKNTSDISTLKTTTQNHSTTLTNLTSSQNTLSSTVSNINNRLTSAESELSAITGGVDLTELNLRLHDVETFSGPIYFNYSKTDMNSLKGTGNWTSNAINFSCKAFTPLHIEINFKYTTAATSGNFVIYNIINQQTIEFTNINVKDNPNGCSYSLLYVPSYNSNYLKFQFSACPIDFVMDSMDISIYGTNVKDMRYTNDFSVFCFGGYIYLTRHYNNYITYGKFLPTDDIDIDNLPNRQDNYMDGFSHFRLYLFPFVRGSLHSDGYYYLDWETDVLIGENTINYLSATKLTEDNYDLGYVSAVRANYGGELVSGMNSNVSRFYIKNDRPGIEYYNNDNKHYALKDSVEGKFIKQFPARKHTRNVGDMSIYLYDIFHVAQKDDGCFYLIRGIDENPYCTKICKGDFATAYQQEDYSVNIYITKGNKVEKYKGYAIEENGSTKLKTNYVKTYSDCDCIMELLNNKVLRHSSTGWKIETLEY